MDRTQCGSPHLLPPLDRAPSSTDLPVPHTVVSDAVDIVSFTMNSGTAVRENGQSL